MMRTQIYLPEEEHRQITQLAQQKGQPMAEIIRVYIKKGLKEEKDIDRSGMEVMKKIANIRAKGGPPDLAINHDYYLYGGDRKQQ